MAVELALQELLTSPDTAPNICHIESIPAQPARLVEMLPDIQPALRDALRQLGITELYTHQAESWHKLRDGHDIVVVTPTASGKTLCYNLPVLDSIMKNNSARALYVFPTKALAQDQVSALHSLIQQTGRDIKTYTYDGDTPQSARKAIRQAGHVVVTNPDMLHAAILPHHTKWVKLFENLEYVVLDEIHQYRGVFGSHFANVLRRLERITKFYGRSPRFVCCSATIANPGELARLLTARDVHVIDQSGAPKVAKKFLFYNPPVVNAELGIRRSSLLEAKKVAAKLMRNDVQTIVFTNSRVRTELLVTYLRQLVSGGAPKDQSVRGYRGGYLPRERRQIERDLRDAKIRTVVATDALELGIDVGQLEACVMSGYPGTIASTWQRAGRAGRRDGQAIAILIASSNALDQYIITHPEFFFAKNPEHALVNPSNLYILLSHLKCAAFELPFDQDEQFGVESTQQVLNALAEQNMLHFSAGKWYWSAEHFPAEDISLRSASSDNFVVIDETSGARVIAEVDRVSAPMLIHEGAIYIHEGTQYHVDRLEYEEHKAYVHRVDVDYYTDANLAVALRVLRVSNRDTRGELHLGYGEVLTTSMVTMYKKVKLHTHENIGSGEVHLPEEQMHTTACWLALGAHLTHTLAQSEVQSVVVSLANLMHSIAPLFLMSDPRDIRVVPEVKAPFTEMPTVYVYDSYPGGIGLAEKLYDICPHVLRTCLSHLEACKCESGCPSCIGSPLEVQCTKGKSLTRNLLAHLLEAFDQNG